MNIKYFLKALGLLILLFFCSIFLGVIIGSIFSPLIAAVIFGFFVSLGLFWIGYINTKTGFEYKYKNSLMLHLILSLVLFLVFIYFSPSELRDNITSTLNFFVFLEIGSVIYYFKSRKKLTI